MAYPRPARRPGRHLDTSTVPGRLARYWNPATFAETMLVVCLVLVLWPATITNPKRPP
jgi:hypothetical protein